MICAAGGMGAAGSRTIHYEVAGVVRKIELSEKPANVTIAHSYRARRIAKGR